MKSNKVDVIILSLVTDERSFEMTSNCVNSYINTANSLINKVFVVESNKQFNRDYNNPKVEVIIPEEEFNYNRFFNIALDRCEAEFVMGPNNDLVVHENCLQTLVFEFNENSIIQSLCPVDREWHKHAPMYLPSNNKVYYGYDVSLHVFGGVCCYRRSVFEKIGYLDERFFFFYQDNDYSMCAQRCNLIHGVHTGARISHMSGGSNRIASGRCQYTPYNMNHQGDIFANKWFKEEPYKSGGFKKFKEYICK